MGIMISRIHKRYSDNQYIQVYPKERPKRPGIENRCEIFIFVLRQEPRVFVGGGEHGFDGLVREADRLEIEALAERFSLEELYHVLKQEPFLPLVNDTESSSTLRADDSHSFWRRILTWITRQNVS